MDLFYTNARETIDLHDILHAWSGLGAATMSLYKQLSSLRRARPSIIIILAFYLASAALHITIPSAMSVDTVIGAANVSTPATTMPGNIISVGYDIDSETSTDTLQNAQASLPHFLAHLNSSKVPDGWNGT